MYVVLLLLSIQKLLKRSAEATISITACFIYRTFHRLTG